MARIVGLRSSAAPWGATVAASTTGTARQAAPRARVGRGRGARVRIGCSRKRCDSTVGARATSAAAGGAQPWPGTSDRANTTKGQCHRYHPYERSPSHRAGATASAALTRPPSPEPAASNSMAASTGTTPTGHGNAVASSNATTAPTSSTAPTAPQPSATARDGDHPRATTRASRQPARNSQARVGAL